jgi:hypothetical protein
VFIFFGRSDIPCCILSSAVIVRDEDNCKHCINTDDDECDDDNNDNHEVVIRWESNDDKLQFRTTTTTTTTTTIAIVAVDSNNDTVLFLVRTIVFVLVKRKVNNHKLIPMFLFLTSKQKPSSSVKVSYYIIDCFLVI